MNSEWVLARIEEFLTLVREYDTAPSDTQENLASDCVKAIACDGADRCEG